MRKLVLSLFLLCSFCVGYAAQISKSQALEIAAKYLPKVGREVLQPMNKVYGVNQSAQEYFIFNAEDGNGFVIVSGDDELSEVVGYSNTGSFKVSEDMPIAIREYLTNYSNYVKLHRSGGALSARKIQKVGTPVVAPMVKTKWDQGEPYNRKAPYDSKAGSRCPTGCVATAYSQVMKYYEWPVSGTGSNEYESAYGVLKEDFSKSVYDWKNMLNEYNSYKDIQGNIKNEYDETQAAAVAKLMWDCGIAVSMDYRAMASGAPGENIPYAVAKNFYYDAEIIYRNGLERNQFLATIKENLDAKRPMVFGGIGSQGGHAFVCDGYDSNDYLHINWGWGGVSDGYFDVDYMDPDNLGTGGGAGGFNLYQSIIVMTPNKTGNVGNLGQFPVQIYDLMPQYTGYFKPSKSEYKKGEDLFAEMKFLYNVSPIDCTWNLAAGIFDGQGNRLLMSSDVIKNYSLPAAMADERVYKINIADIVSTLSDGKYVVKLMSKEIRQGQTFDWINASTTKKFILIVKGEDIFVNEVKREIEQASPIVSDFAEYKVGEKANFTVTFSNPSDLPVSGTLKFLVTDAVTGLKKKTLTTSLKIAPAGTSDVKFTIDITASPFTVGKKFKISTYSYSPLSSNHKLMMPTDDKACIISIVEEKGGVSQLEASSVSVYPNPASDYVKVNVDAEVVAIELYNAGGSLVKKVAGTNEISVSDCPAGYYLVNVVTEKGSLRKSVIVK